jgi:hypothetical protein
MSSNVGTLLVFRIGGEEAQELGTDARALTDTAASEAWLKRSDANPRAHPAS